MRKLRNSELERLTVDKFKESEKNPLIIVLDNIRSANNVGSVFRTADAFLLETIHLCGVTATPPNKDIRKTALGASESMEWKYFENTIDSVKELQQNGYTVIPIEQVEKSTNLLDFSPEKGKKYAFVFGNEIKGVEQDVIDLCETCIEIPQYGTKHSLNISVSAGVLIWDFFQKVNS